MGGTPVPSRPRPAQSAELSRAHKQAATALEQLADAEGEISRLQGELDANDELQGQMLSHIAQTDAALRASREGADRLEELGRVAEEKARDLEGTVQSALAGQTAAEVRLEAALSALAAARAKEAQHAAGVAEMKRALVDLAAAKKAAEAELAEARVDLTAAVEAELEISTALGIVRGDLEAARSELSIQRQAATEARIDGAQAKDELAEVRAVVAELDEKARSLQSVGDAALSELSGVHEQAIATMQAAHEADRVQARMAHQAEIASLGDAFDLQLAEVVREHEAAAAQRRKSAEERAHLERLDLEARYATEADAHREAVRRAEHAEAEAHSRGAALQKTSELIVLLEVDEAEASKARRSSIAAMLDAIQEAQSWGTAVPAAPVVLQKAAKAADVAVLVEPRLMPEEAAADPALDLDEAGIPPAMEAETGAAPQPPTPASPTPTSVTTSGAGTTDAKAKANALIKARRRGK